MMIMAKKDVYDQYSNVMGKLHAEVISYLTFIAIWNNLYPLGPDDLVKVSVHSLPILTVI